MKGVFRYSGHGKKKNNMGGLARIVFFFQQVRVVRSVGRSVQSRKHTPIGVIRSINNGVVKQTEKMGFVCKKKKKRKRVSNTPKKKKKRKEKGRGRFVV